MHAANSEGWCRTNGAHLSTLGAAIEGVHLVAQAPIWSGVQRLGKAGRVERCRCVGEDLGASGDQGEDCILSGGAIGNNRGGEAALIQRRNGTFDLGAIGHLLKTCCAHLYLHGAAPGRLPR